MSDGTLNTRHSLTGQLQRLMPSQIRAINRRGEVLEIVPDDAKPYAPGFFKPGLVGEFKNTEPPTDAVADAQAAYDAVLAEHAPNSNVARDAKAALDAAIAKADEDRQAAEAAAEQIQNEGEAADARLAEAASGTAPATGEGKK